MSLPHLTQPLTLHFDLTHCPTGTEFTLRSLGILHGLQRHTSETLAHHAQKNAALSLIPAEKRHRITHFAERIEMPVDAVGHHWVSYPSKTSEHYLPEIALMFVHIPWAARWRAMERRHRRGEAPVLPQVLAHYGVKQLPASGWKEILEASYQIITPAKTAELIVSKHPDIASLKPDIAGHISQIIESVIQNNGANLIEYLKENPQSWYTKDWAKQASNDNPPKVGYARPSPDQGIDWPLAPDGLPGIPTYDLSDALIGTDASPGYAASAVATVLRMIANDTALNGQKWTAQAGT